MLTILFQDRRIAILDKPAGLPAHPGPRGGPSVEDHLPALRRNARRGGPWLAHRLDADTSGCLAVALTKSALIAAQAAFATGRAAKTYWALVRGRPAADAGRIANMLRKTSSEREGWRMVAQEGEGAQPAVSDWRVLARDGDTALLEMLPRTGRTHQVRVHCAWLGCPILGDPIYGHGGGALCLLARRLELPLDPTVAATAPVPPHMLHAAMPFPSVYALLRDAGAASFRAKSL